MTTPSPEGTYRKALREQLTIAGPPSLEMLHGQAPLDPLVVLSALEAAGLLATDDELGRLAQRLRAAPEEQVAKALQNLDLSEQAVDLAAAADDDDRYERLERLVSLAGVLHAVVEAPSSAPLRQAVERNAFEASMEPERFAALSDQAMHLATLLDLDDTHPAQALLQEVMEAAGTASMPFDEAAARRGLQRAGAEVVRSPWTRWADKAGEIRDDLRDYVLGLVARPVLAAAASVPGATPPEPRVLAQRAEDEVVLFPEGPELRVGWYGNRPPRSLELDGRPLEQAPAPMADGRAWRLPAEDVSTTSTLRLVWDDDDWTIPLGRER